jgi:hypothetical protein
MIDWSLVFIGFLGGLAAAGINLGTMTSSAKIAFFKDLPDAVFTFVVLPAVGAFFVYLYLSSGYTFNPVIAANVGITAPFGGKVLASGIAAKPGTYD